MVDGTVEETVPQEQSEESMLEATPEPQKKDEAKKDEKPANAEGQQNQ